MLRLYLSRSPHFFFRLAVAILWCHSKSTGKETGKTHYCAMVQPSFHNLKDPTSNPVIFFSYFPEISLFQSIFCMISIIKFRNPEQVKNKDSVYAMLLLKKVRWMVPDERWFFSKSVTCGSNPKFSSGYGFLILNPQNFIKNIVVHTLKFRKSQEQISNLFSYPPENE